MQVVACPYCGHKHEVDATEIIETRTVGVTDDWETWETLLCENCRAEFIYRTE